MNSEITPDFLSRGETNAFFQHSGKSPDVREQLIMRVITAVEHRDRRPQAMLELDQVDKTFLQIVGQASGLRPH